MQVTVQIPDELSRLIPAGKSLSRELLEAFAADAYRNGKLTRHQVGQLLGLDRWQAEEFLARHQAQGRSPSTTWNSNVARVDGDELVAVDRATLERLW